MAKAGANATNHLFGTPILIEHSDGTFRHPSATYPLPTTAGAGSATSAKQDEQTALLTTIDSDTGNLGAINTAATSLATMVSARSAVPAAGQPGQALLAVLDVAVTDQTGSDADGELTPLRANTYGVMWVDLATALNAGVDSIAIKSVTTQIKKSYNATAQKTGEDVWTPAAGKKIRITDMEIGTYGTTAGRVIFFFSANADTTYSEGADETPFKASFAPSATVKPGAVVHFSPPFEATTADHELHCTTDAGISLDAVFVGYEE